MEFTIRTASKEYVSSIVAMLADDPLGALREEFTDPLPEFYYEAYANITQDPNQELVVICEGDTVIGTLQLSLIQYLTYSGGIRAQIEAVRVHKDWRSKGIGQKLFEWAIKRSRERGAHLVQLTTDKKRPDAKAFYEKLGFKASHEGMKLHFGN